MPSDHHREEGFDAERRNRRSRSAGRRDRRCGRSLSPGCPDNITRRYSRDRGDRRTVDQRCGQEIPRAPGQGRRGERGHRRTGLGSSDRDSRCEEDGGRRRDDETGSRSRSGVEQGRRRRSRKGRCVACPWVVLNTTRTHYYRACPNLHEAIRRGFDVNKPLRKVDPAVRERIKREQRTAAGAARARSGCSQGDAVAKAEDVQRGGATGEEKPSEKKPDVSAAGEKA